ncbi:unnamed protein product [Phyllotreta striolata]|uniref:P-type domain-containing protein n=1 Tax=Phyllotreta striolata TaxID=444603 RepID=A0A9N9XQ18_PHYSR|nr:unnamed protein product [Phyllotreta striolata]
MTSFIDEQQQIRNLERQQDDKDKVSWITIVTSTSAQGWAFVVSFAIFVPILTYYIVNLNNYTLIDSSTCFVNETFRIPCGKANISETDCYNIDCCYDKPTKKCYHYLPSKYFYSLANHNYYSTKTKSPFNTAAVETMKISVDETSENQLSIYLHEAATKINTTTLKQKNFVVNPAKDKLMIEVNRPDGQLLLSTALGPLIASKNYWEWTLHLTGRSLFGLDGTLIALQGNATLKRVIYGNGRDRGWAPVFWAHDDGRFHGVSVRHAGPLEVEVLASNVIILRSLTGGCIEVVLSVGPTPASLHDQQMDAKRAGELPYWLLGTHVCKKREVYNNLTDLMVHVGDEDSQADSYCVDDNLFMYLQKEDLNSTKSIGELKKYVSDLSSKGKKFLLSIPPQIIKNTTLWNLAEKLNILYQFNQSEYVGKYLQQDVVYPDYSDPKIQVYIQEIDKLLKEYINVTIDGFVLSDNWPLNDNFIMDNASFPYFDKDLQASMSHTIQWNATIKNVQHIIKHTSYGCSQYEAFRKYNDSKLILSAAKSSSEVYPTILQNVDASWEHLKTYLSAVLFNSVNGNHIVSLPVCGDTAKFNETIQSSLCLRWYIISATMPFLRATSPQPWRNPADLSTKFDQQIVQNMLDKRRLLQPYFYAILSKNQPMVRPMFYDYYQDTKTFAMVSQYMIGEKLLVAHPLTANRARLSVYLPPKVRVWYEFRDGEMFISDDKSNETSVDIIETDFVMFVAQGSVVALVDGNDIDLTVAMNSSDTKINAEGSIKVENQTIHFRAYDEYVQVISNSTVNYTLKNITVYSYEKNKSFKESYKKNLFLNETTMIYYRQLKQQTLVGNQQQLQGTN